MRQLKMSEMGKLPTSIKDLVNNGILKLFQYTGSIEIDDVERKYEYVLYMGSDIYLLDLEGLIVSKGNKTDDYSSGEPVIFIKD